MQPAFERALKRYRNNESLDWFDRFEDVCTITPGPEPEPEEGDEGSGPYWRGA
jgi:hypothetical protein